MQDGISDTIHAPAGLELIFAMPEPHATPARLAVKYRRDLNEACEGLPVLGPYRHADGSVYVGQYRDGKRHGRGRLIEKDGSLLDGNFLEDLAHGDCNYYWKHGDTYLGEYKNGDRNGVGVCYYAGNRQYDGQWKNGKKHGFGRYSHFDGSVFEGEFVNGKREQKAITYFRSGEIHDSPWTNDRESGQAFALSKDFKVKTSYFAHGHSWQSGNSSSAYEDDDDFGDDYEYYGSRSRRGICSLI